MVRSKVGSGMVPKGPFHLQVLQLILVRKRTKLPQFLPSRQKFMSLEGEYVLASVGH